MEQVQRWFNERINISDNKRALLSRYLSGVKVITDRAVTIAADTAHYNPNAHLAIIGDGCTGISILNSIRSKYPELQLTLVSLDKSVFDNDLERKLNSTDRHLQNNSELPSILGESLLSDGHTINDKSANFDHTQQPLNASSISQSTDSSLAETANASSESPAVTLTTAEEEEEPDAKAQSIETQDSPTADGKTFEMKFIASAVALEPHYQETNIDDNQWAAPKAVSSPRCGDANASNSGLVQLTPQRYRDAMLNQVVTAREKGVFRHIELPSFNGDYTEVYIEGQFVNINDTTMGLETAYCVYIALSYIDLMTSLHAIQAVLARTPKIVIATDGISKEVASKLFPNKSVTIIALSEPIY